MNKYIARNILVILVFVLKFAAHPLVSGRPPTLHKNMVFEPQTLTSSVWRDSLEVKTSALIWFGFNFRQCHFFKYISKQPARSARVIPGHSWLVPGRILVDSWSIWHNCCCCLDTRIPTSPTRILVDSWWKEFLVIPGIPGRNDKESGRNLAGMKIMELVRFCQFGWVPSPGHSCQNSARFLADSWSFLPGMPGIRGPV